MGCSLVYDVVICDDSTRDLKTIIDLVKEFFKSNNIQYNLHIFNNYDENYKQIIYSGLANPIFLMDIETPGGSGIEYGRLISNFNSFIPIFYITGFADKYKDNVLNECNMKAYIDKFGDLKQNLFKKLEFVTNNGPIKTEIKLSCYKNIKKSFTLEYLTYISTGKKNTIEVHSFGDEASVLRSSLKTAKKESKELLKQTHKSCIVNFNNVSKYYVKKKIIEFHDGSTTDLISRDFFLKNKKWLEENYSSIIEFD